MIQISIKKKGNNVMNYQRNQRLLFLAFFPDKIIKNIVKDKMFKLLKGHVLIADLVSVTVDFSPSQ